MFDIFGQELLIINIEKFLIDINNTSKMEPGKLKQSDSKSSFKNDLVTCFRTVVDDLKQTMDSDTISNLFFYLYFDENYIENGKTFLQEYLKSKPKGLLTNHAFQSLG